MLERVNASPCTPKRGEYTPCIDPLEDLDPPKGQCVALHPLGNGPLALAQDPPKSQRMALYLL